MPKLNIHIGDRFGRLTVIEEARNAKNVFCYKCRCDCGTEKLIMTHSLVSGLTQSCGCLHRERSREANKKENCFILNPSEGIATGITHNTGKEFLISIEDLEKVKKYCWYEAKNGYITTEKIGYLHRFLLKPEKDLVVDHINHNRADNRRDNLRICSVSENGLNRAIPPKGITKKKQGNQTYYLVYMKGKYQGIFKTVEEAKTLRDKIYKEEYIHE